MEVLETSTLADDLVFPESPRWYGGFLWISDVVDRKVHKIDLDGNTERVLTLSDQPSGLGFLPDGSLLVVSMSERLILRWHNNRLERHSDLSQSVNTDLNDMVVSNNGYAYVGNYGFDKDWRAACLSIVRPDGASEIVARELHFPNGCVLSEDGARLIVAETFGNKLTEFQVAPNGELGERREFADLQNVAPDGICLCSDGSVWVAAAARPEFLKVHEGGRISARVSVPGRQAIACALGGEDGQTLFCCTADEDFEARGPLRRTGRVEVANASKLN